MRRDYMREQLVTLLNYLNDRRATNTPVDSRSLVTEHKTVGELVENLADFYGRS